MLLSGILLMLAGAASIVMGITQNNDVERQLEAIFNDGVTNPGTVWIVIGAIVVVIGIILLIFHLKKK